MAGRRLLVRAVDERAPSGDATAKVARPEEVDRRAFGSLGECARRRPPTPEVEREPDEGDVVGSPAPCETAGALHAVHAATVAPERVGDGTASKPPRSEVGGRRAGRRRPPAPLRWARSSPSPTRRSIASHRPERAGPRRQRGKSRQPSSRPASARCRGRVARSAERDPARSWRPRPWTPWWTSAARGGADSRTWTTRTPPGRTEARQI